MSSSVNANHGIESAEQLSDEDRSALRELLLVLADCKRLLGIRYADFILGAPSLESGIAAASMAQDEWGHSRLMYALLADFGDDPEALEHGREATEYRSCELLDTPFRSWVEVIVIGFLFDTSLSLQYDALASSRYVPARNRVQKMLDEERFHFQHAVSWIRRLARSEGSSKELEVTVGRVLPTALRWFGRPDAPAIRHLAEQRFINIPPDSLRARLLTSVGPLIEELGIAEAVRVRKSPDGWTFLGEIGWNEWDDVARRTSGSKGPDAATLARVRGDSNRAFLVDS